MHIDRDEAIKRIRAALKKKTGKSWSVTGDRGTAWGWIKVEAPPRRRVWHEKIAEFDASMPGADWYKTVREVPIAKDDPKRAYGYTSVSECREIAAAFGLKNKPYGVHHQGLSINPDSREWYVAQIEA